MANKSLDDSTNTSFEAVKAEMVRRRVMYFFFPPEELTSISRGCRHCAPSLTAKLLEGKTLFESEEDLVKWFAQILYTGERLHWISLHRLLMPLAFVVSGAVNTVISN